MYKTFFKDFGHFNISRWTCKETIIMHIQVLGGCSVEGLFFFFEGLDCSGQHKILDILILPWPILGRKKIALTKDLFYLCFVLRIPLCPTEVSSLLMLSVCKNKCSLSGKRVQGGEGRARDARAVDFKQGTCKDGNLPS